MSTWKRSFLYYISFFTKKSDLHSFVLEGHADVKVTGVEAKAVAGRAKQGKVAV
jgi:hypothetical protein